MPAKVAFSETTTVIDQEGNRIMETQNRTIRYDTEPNYVKIYLDTVLYISDLPKGYNSILMSFLTHMTYASTNNNYGGQIIYTNKQLKEDIANRNNVSLARVNQSLSDFCKGKLFERIGTATYRVNPHLFGKGDWSDIAKIRMEITFDASGKSVMSEIEKHNQEKEKTPPEQETENSENGQALDPKSPTDQPGPISFKSQRKSYTKREAV